MTPIAAIPTPATLQESLRKLSVYHAKIMFPRTIRRPIRDPEFRARRGPCRRKEARIGRGEVRTGRTRPDPRPEASRHERPRRSGGPWRGERISDHPNGLAWRPAIERGPSWRVARGSGIRCPCSRDLPAAPTGPRTRPAGAKPPILPLAGRTDPAHRLRGSSSWRGSRSSPPRCPSCSTWAGTCA